jgi:hypothetical protein
MFQLIYGAFSVFFWGAFFLVFLVFSESGPLRCSRLSLTHLLPRCLS